MTEAERSLRLRRAAQLVLEVTGDPALSPRERRSLRHLEDVVQHASAHAEHQSGTASVEAPAASASAPAQERPQRLSTDGRQQEEVTTPRQRADTLGRAAALAAEVAADPDVPAGMLGVLEHMDDIVRLVAERFRRAIPVEGTTA